MVREAYANEARLCCDQEWNFLQVCLHDQRDWSGPILLAQCLEELDYLWLRLVNQFEAMGHRGDMYDQRVR